MNNINIEHLLNQVKVAKDRNLIRNYCIVIHDYPKEYRWRMILDFKFSTNKKTKLQLAKHITTEYKEVTSAYLTENEDSLCVEYEHDGNAKKIDL